jgi:mRNA-degrading endonuclease RelE of RelBE toxin-antitoxin system
MRKAILSFLVALCLLRCGIAGPGKEYWVDRAQPLDLFEGRDVIALAAAGGKLYVSTGESIFIVALGKYTQTAVTQRINKQTEDRVTEILVDAGRKELWIVLNDNTHLASCYDYDLAAKSCLSSFLDERMALYEKLQRNGPNSSINALAFDAHQAIVGYFKGGIYLYSIDEGKYRLVYQPTSIDKWAVSCALTKDAAIVSTRGDGLIVVNRKTAVAARFLDKDGNYGRSLTVHDQDLYIGAKGLYRARIADFVTLP